MNQSFRIPTGRLHLFLFLFCSMILGTLPLYSQQVDSLPGRPGHSFRGLSVVSDQVVWVSGNKGTVGISTDGGNSFQWQQVKGHESRDFRDIEAFDAQTAVVLAVDSPGLVLRTEDGGQSWTEVYRDQRSGIFLDALHFSDEQNGALVGDPIGGTYVVLTTSNQGRSWSPLESPPYRPDTGEACFAASGSNIISRRGTPLVISGGTRSRLFRGQQVIDLPLVQGKNSTGANAIALRPARHRPGKPGGSGGSGRRYSQRHFVVVGGDFAADTLRSGNIALTRNGGRNWQQVSIPPFGYRSSVVYLDRSRLVSCGTSGVDVSADGGRSWQNISTTGYHVVQKAKKGKAVFLAGGNGRMARLRW